MSRQAGTASFEKIQKNYSTLKKNNSFNTFTQNTIERNRSQQHIVKSENSLLESNTSEYYGRIDGYDGLYTTKQLESVDFSKFENHVFFDSAVSKVHYSYDTILNYFPYDKSKHEFDQYFKKMCGFTNYVYKNYIPKNLGYLSFDGNNEVYIKDVTGNILNDYTGEKKFGLVDINRLKFTFDFWLYINDVEDNNELGTQVIFQKIDQENGLTIYINNLQIDNDTNKKYCDINLLITNENSYYLCSSLVEIAIFNHINFSCFISKGKRKSNFYRDGIRRKSNHTGSLSRNKKFNDDFLKSDIFIGNGVNHNVIGDSNLNVIKTTGLIGIIDEFRFFTDTLSESDIQKYKFENIFSRKSLALYYRFNEPAGDFLNNNITLDHSGNKIHGIIRNNNLQLYAQEEILAYRQQKTGIETPVKYESEYFNPVIFVRYGNILEQQNELLQAASDYDKVNPNIFYNFFPKHLFVETSDFEAASSIFVTEELVAERGDQALNLLKAKIPQNTTLIKLVTIWARFFDQLKCYIDQISNIINVDYDELNNGKDQSGVILKYAVSKLGFDFEEIFPSPILDKLENKNLTREEVLSEKSIRQIQNNLWKRFLINSQGYMKSKGTISAIKQVFNSFGLESNNFIDIREFNSQNKLNLYAGFKESYSNIKYINFLEKINLGINQSFNVNGYPENSLLVESNLFNLQENLFNLENDWSVESFISFDNYKQNNYNNKQSVFRIDTVSQDNSIKPYINVIVEKTSSNIESSTLSLYINELNENSIIKKVTIEDTNIFSGKIYYICVSKKKITEKTNEYTLSFSNSAAISLDSLVKSVKVRVDTTESQVNIDSPTLRFGNSSFYSSNDILSMTNMDFSSKFEGNLFNFKVWKKILSEKEKNLHKTDFYCYGIDSKDIIDSISDLIIHVNLKQNFENLFQDINQNYLHLKDELLNPLVESKLFVPQNYLGNNFIENKDYIVYRQTNQIDYPENFNRVNINSYQDASFSKYLNNSMEFPSHETESNFSSFDDIRLSIDFSAVKFVNQEIAKMISVNDFFTQNLSNRACLYEDQYQSMTELRNVFYNKLKEEINIKQLYQVYKYFDNILENILNDTIPSKVNYLGFNFVYESSIAERNKYQYKMSDSRFSVVDSNINYSTYNTRYSSPDYWNNSDVRLSTFNNSDNSSIITKTPFI